MSETIKEKKVFSIKPFSHIRIGDAMYFEMMKNGSTNENMKNITILDEVVSIKSAYKPENEEAIDSLVKSIMEK